LRSLDMLIEEGMVVKIAPLPKGMDPDTQVRKNGIASLQDIIVNSSNLFDYKLDILKSRHDIKDAHGKSKIAAQMLSTIYRFDDAILRAEYVKKLAAEIEIAERYILEELNKIKPNIPAASSAPLGTAAVPVKNNSFINPAEKLLIKFMLEENELIEKIMQELEPDDFQDMRTTRIVSLMQDLATKGKAVAPNILMNYFDEDDAGKLLGESMFMPEVSERDREKALHDCIQRIKCQRSKKRRENLQIQIKKAQSSGDKQRLGSLIQEFHNLIKKGD